MWSYVFQSVQYEAIDLKLFSVAVKLSNTLQYAF